MSARSLPTAGPAALAALTVLLAAGPAGAQEPADAAPTASSGGAPAGGGGYANTPEELVPYRRGAAPYRRFYEEAPQHRGPGREVKPWYHLKEVKIGLLAPLEGTRHDALGQSMKRGAELAIEETNKATGGLRGVLPFALVPRNDSARWGSSANTMLQFEYEDEVWAVIGSIDSNTTHVALRAALRTECTILAVGSTDPTMTETGIPWMVQMSPDARQTAYKLALRIFEQLDKKRVAVVRSSDRLGRMGVAELRDAARRLSRPVPGEMLFDPGLRDFSEVIDRLAGANPDAIVVWGDAEDAGHLVSQIRQRGLTAPIFGNERLKAAAFLEAAGPAAEGVTVAYPFRPDSEAPLWVAFRKRFVERWGTEPDLFAAYGFDAARMVIEATMKASLLNKVRIRDILTGVREYQGATGLITFSPTSNNISPMHLATVKGGAFVFE